MRLRVAFLLVAGFFPGCGPQVTPAGDSSDTGDCEPGTKSCVCRRDSTCDAPLYCDGGGCADDLPSTSAPGSEGQSETGAEPLVACCHDEAFPDGDSPYGRIYCDIPGVELGEHCSCNPVFSDGIGCEYSGEERVPFCCWGEIAECCAVGDPPAAGQAQNPWTIPCARCACSPNQSGVGSPSWDPDDAQCE